jgi:ATP adenylyltransferase
MKYVTSNDKMKEGCVFCHHLQDDPANDRENYVVYRGDTTFTVLNLYPYNSGHLMILPHKHVPGLADVSADVQFELISLTSYFTELLTELMHPDGFNVGLNLGQAAGAGIDSHLHIHIVPRWKGDSNFMPVVGETRVLPEELVDTYDKIVALLRDNPPRLQNLLEIG